MAWVALWRAFQQTRKYSFLMISPKLLDISPFFLLIFSPLEKADFLMLLKLPGDGYSLLCSKKHPPRHNCKPPSATYVFQPLNRLQLIHPNVPSHYRPFRVFEYCFPVLQSGEQLDFRYLLACTSGGGFQVLLACTSGGGTAGFQIVLSINSVGENSWISGICFPVLDVLNNLEGR